MDRWKITGEFHELSDWARDSESDRERDKDGWSGNSALWGKHSKVQKMWQ
jgi:hypothetical protein